MWSADTLVSAHPSMGYRSPSNVSSYTRSSKRGYVAGPPSEQRRNGTRAVRCRSHNAIKHGHMRPCGRADTACKASCWPWTLQGRTTTAEVVQKSRRTRYSRPCSHGEKRWNAHEFVWPLIFTQKAGLENWAEINHSCAHRAWAKETRTLVPCFPFTFRTGGGKGGLTTPNAAPSFKISARHALAPKYVLPTAFGRLAVTTYPHPPPNWLCCRFLCP